MGPPQLVSRRDPEVRAKAARGLDLYHRMWEQMALWPNEYVLSADEKTSIQARGRAGAGLPGPGRVRRVESDYDWGGALAYIATGDVHRAKVCGLCRPTTGIDSFNALLDLVMTQEPYRSAARVFWGVDNGSSHRGQAATIRTVARYPNIVLVHTPVYASWLDQIEIYFSVVQRKVLTPNELTDLVAAEAARIKFQPYDESTTQPFA